MEQFVENSYGQRNELNHEIEEVIDTFLLFSYFYEVAYLCIPRSFECVGFLMVSITVYAFQEKYFHY